MENRCVCTLFSLCSNLDAYLLFGGYCNDFVSMRMKGQCSKNGEMEI